MDPQFSVMEIHNSTSVEFVLIGFPVHPNLNIILFLTFLVMYIFTLFGNMLIIVIYRLDACLRTPMYFFLSHFSILEIGYTTVTVPNLLHYQLSRNKTISFQSCLTQMYFFFFFGTAEFFFLALMAFDRYVAICHPLHYHSIMDSRSCSQMVSASWILSSLVPVCPTSIISRLPFGGNRRINHFFCDVGPVIKLSTSVTFLADLSVFMVSALVVLSSFLLIVYSYVSIIVTILRIPSATGRKKAFSTCGSHLIVVTIFFGTVIFMYVRPASLDSADHNKAVSFFYSVVTPMLNPIIYSLRNKEVKEALSKVTGRMYPRRKPVTVICTIMH
ncbi:olfactory receptor 6F1-like [Ambystoma mexicanum]|uniref:olfactory receptor 6F1-like n=1 Tax=Ambystoma mexicanum TaxID=8296 RepID=UPI0037E85FD5